jgi:uncharacterized membrane protein YkvA (DUF1232 family)
MNMLQNKFFSLALSRAASMAGKPGRVLSLLAQLALKIRKTNGKSVELQTLREYFLVIGRMLKAQMSGTYKIKSTKLLMALLGAVIYFVNPLDLIPDFILGIGLADDFAVLMWVYKIAEKEIVLFQQWEGSVLKINQ